MVALLNLSAGFACLSLVPKMGGGIARLVHGEKPVLRRWSGDREQGPFALASNILVPFSNRISNGGFGFQGKAYAIAPNCAGQTLPIQGDGFQKSWAVVSHTASPARLALNTGSVGPYKYNAEQIFLLSEHGLRIELKVNNDGSETLPFGCGFHPWFPRNRHTRLSFSARRVWMEDKRHLPTTHLEYDDNSKWDFRGGRKLPENWLNNVWTDWAGTAQIDQSERLVSVSVNASSNLNCALLYSTGQDCDFICFEPISHPVDAHNLSGLPGLMMLDPVQSMRARMEIVW